MEEIVGESLDDVEYFTGESVELPDINFSQEQGWRTATYNAVLDKIDVYDISQKDERDMINDIGHELFHAAYSQKKYPEIENFKQLSSWLNSSRQRRKQLVPDERYGLFKFGESIIVNSMLDTRVSQADIERGIKLSLKEHEITDIFQDYLDEYEQIVAENTDKDDRPLYERIDDQVEDSIFELEKDLRSDVRNELKEIPDAEVKTRIEPFNRRKAVIEMNDSQMDEVAALMYSLQQHPLPEQDVIGYIADLSDSPDLIYSDDELAVDYFEDPGPFDMDNAVFCRSYATRVGFNYGETVEEEFWNKSESYRNLREDGYSQDEALKTVISDIYNSINSLE